MENLHKLREYIEEQTKENNIKESCLLTLLEHCRKISNDISSLSSEIEILDNKPKLDLIDLLFKEGIELQEIGGEENVYIDLAYQQFKKLREPF